MASHGKPRDSFSVLLLHLAMLSAELSSAQSAPIQDEPHAPTIELDPGHHEYRKLVELTGPQRRKAWQWPVMPEHRTMGNPWLTPDRERRFGLSQKGDTGRLRAALGRARNGHNLTVAVIGGSIAAGAGAVDMHSWPEWLEEWLNSTYPSKARVIKGGVPGTMSSYMSMCHNVHVPKDADLVILDYSLNDMDPPNPPFNNAMRRSFERLIRKLLTYPNKPAVMLLNAYGYLWGLPQEVGLYWAHNSEGDFSELASYYRLPVLSVKAAAYHLMKQGVPGFNVSQPRSKDGMLDIEKDAEYREKLFYYDRVHPDGWTGHLVMAELVAQFFLDTEADLAVNPITALDGLDAVAPLPVPMIPDNFESISDKCFIGDQFKLSVVSSTGWEWKSDSPDPERPKYGYITTEPGSVLKLKLDTMAPSSKLMGTVNDYIIVELAYLKSYRKMGRALVKCESGCKCDVSALDGHTEAKTSLLNLHEIKVTQAEECIITVTSLPATTEGTKVKVSGVMISDDGGKFSRAFGNAYATEYVHDAAIGSVFTIEKTL